MLKKYYSDNLTGRVYDAYFSIDGAVRAYRDDCTLYGVTADEATLAINAFFFDNPDVYFCCAQFVTMEGSSQGVRLRFSYHQCDEGKFARELKKITDELDKKITSQTTDYDVAKAAYDVLAATVKGDSEVLCAYGRLNVRDRVQVEEFSQTHGTSFCAYGAIVEKKAVCMGVSLAYKLLLDKYRVECAVVTGDYNGIPHMMNVVEADGKRAYVDVTKGFMDEQLPMVRYDVFMMGEKKVRKYFAPQQDFGCVDEDLHYFAKNGFWFKDGYALRRYLNSFTYEKTGGEVRFYYTGKGFDDRALGKLAGDILPRRCGTEFDYVGCIVEHGVGNAILKKHKE